LTWEGGGRKRGTPWRASPPKNPVFILGKKEGENGTKKRERTTVQREKKRKGGEKFNNEPSREGGRVLDLSEKKKKGRREICKGGKNDLPLMVSLLEGGKKRRGKNRCVGLGGGRPIAHKEGEETGTLQEGPPQGEKKRREEGQMQLFWRWKVDRRKQMKEEEGAAPSEKNEGIFSNRGGLKRKREKKRRKNRAHPNGKLGRQPADKTREGGVGEETSRNFLGGGGPVVMLLHGGRGGEKGRNSNRCA